MWTGWLVTRVGVVALLLTHRVIRAVPLGTDVTHVYFSAAHRLMSGAIPYRDFPFEYPPGTFPFLAGGWLLGGHSPDTFLVRWLIMMVLLDSLVMWGLAGRASGDRQWAQFGWLVGGVLLFPVFARNDMVPTAAYVLGFVFTFNRSTFFVGLSWGIGFLAKLWPGFVAAAVMLARPTRRWQLAAGFALPLAAAVLLLALTGAIHPMLSYLNAYQGRRPIEIESTWADIDLLRARAIGATLHPVRSYGSVNFVDAEARTFDHIALPATWAVQVLVVLVPLVIRAVTRRVPSAAAFAWIFAGYVAASLLVTPVLSAQYLLWLLGAACVVAVVDAGPLVRALAVICLAACAMTTVIFPGLWLQLYRGDAPALIALTVRNALIVAALAVAVFGARAALRADAGPTSRAEPGGVAARCPRR